MPRPFLTARWEHLIFLSYDCPASLLEPHVPRGTVLDTWQGRTFVSLVAFLFTETRVRGLPIPCHTTFEEVNLRFYVRHETANGELRRAVVFIKELVPRRAIAALARSVYNEPYVAVPMSSVIDLDGPRGGLVAYFWSMNRQPYGIQATIPAGPPAETTADSLAEFITEHYWGYTRQLDGGTMEYQVTHPRWPVWEPSAWAMEGDMGAIYGEEFRPVLAQKPVSVLVAPGSPITVGKGQRLTLPST
jgi:uncharacterized protein YqjF (DUF2071 family)